MRTKACLKSGASVCAAIGGFINMKNWVGLDSENTAINVVSDVLSVGAGAACQYGGVGPLCGIISASFEQISKAVITGNNDWAECLGISSYFRCRGAIWGSKGWMNNEGVQGPYRVAERNPPPVRDIERGEFVNVPVEWWVRPCCACRRTYYKNQGWFVSPKEVAGDNYLSVIQKGDFASGNCKHQETKGKISPGGAQHYGFDYYRYTDCQRITVVGDVCAFPRDVNGNEGHLRLWDSARQKPADLFLVPPSRDRSPFARR
jgi:hypothetical protein